MGRVNKSVAHNRPCWGTKKARSTRGVPNRAGERRAAGKEQRPAALKCRSWNVVLTATPAGMIFRGNRKGELAQLRPCAFDTTISRDNSRVCASDCKSGERAAKLALSLGKIGVCRQELVSIRNAKFERSITSCLALVRGGFDHADARRTLPRSCGPCPSARPSKRKRRFRVIYSCVRDTRKHGPCL